MIRLQYVLLMCMSSKQSPYLTVIAVLPLLPLAMRSELVLWQGLRQGSSHLLQTSAGHKLMSGAWHM